MTRDSGSVPNVNSDEDLGEALRGFFRVRDWLLTYPTERDMPSPREQLLLEAMGAYGRNLGVALERVVSRRSPSGPKQDLSALVAAAIETRNWLGSIRPDSPTARECPDTQQLMSMYSVLLHQSIQRAEEVLKG